METDDFLPYYYCYEVSKTGKSLPFHSVFCLCHSFSCPSPVYETVSQEPTRERRESDSARMQTWTSKMKQTNTYDVFLCLFLQTVPFPMTKITMRLIIVADSSYWKGRHADTMENKY